MELIEGIKTRPIRELCLAYYYWYFLREGDNRMWRSCGCTEENKWPHNKLEDGTPAICEAHEWQDKQRKLQRLMITSGLSIPIPRLAGERALKLAHKKIEDLSIVLEMESHPFRTYPVIEFVNGNHMGADIAGCIARLLTRNYSHYGKQYATEHVVVLMHKSRALDLTYNRREEEIEETLLYAPVIVFWDNPDGRGNGRPLSLLKSRQYGIAIGVTGA